MLKYFSSIWDYRAFLKSRKSSLDSSQHLRLSSKSFLSASHKLKKLDPSLVQDILLPLYSSTGRPAIDPAVFIRSFVLMQHLGYLSLHKWCDDLASDSLLVERHIKYTKKIKLNARRHNVKFRSIQII